MVDMDDANRIITDIYGPAFVEQLGVESPMMETLRSAVTHQRPANEHHVIVSGHAAGEEVTVEWDDNDPDHIVTLSAGNGCEDGTVRLAGDQVNELISTLEWASG